jgi:FKBP-type peptidyl-prolyl cis-trans isomerase
MKILTMIVCLILAAGLPACAKETSATETEASEGAQTAPTDLSQRASYSIGANLGRNFKSDGIEIDVDQLMQGVKDALSGADLAMTDEEMGQAMQELQAEVMAKRQQEQATVGTKNIAEGQAFLAENKGKAGVMSTASGLQYEVIEEGTGAKPSATSQVTVHYTGTLLDGTKFDSSVDRGTPATFGLNQVISGWTEGLQLMSAGSKYRFYIPSELAYGPSPPPGPIGPNATLIFDVELISIDG